MTTQLRETSPIAVMFAFWKSVVPPSGYRHQQVDWRPWQESDAYGQEPPVASVTEFAPERSSAPTRGPARGRARRQALPITAGADMKLQGWLRCGS